MSLRTNADRAIRSVLDGQSSFCRFLTANDTGRSGGHQSGIYVPKSARSLLFEDSLERGRNVDRWAKLVWQGEFVTNSRLVYYGAKTRNEYRITNCSSRDYNPLGEENTGALLVLVRESRDDYAGWILNTDEEITSFLDAFGIDPLMTGQLIDARKLESTTKLRLELDKAVDQLHGMFPSAESMSQLARRIYYNVHDHEENIVAQPDSELIAWLATEYELFRRVEESIYSEQIRRGFPSMQSFLDTANSVMNRRKSRAGKSLEQQLTALFNGNVLPFESQVHTEGKKQPDFIFPSGAAYHDPNFDSDKLIVLSAKTTCKDRWRQILSEAERVRHRNKYLCTLQRGISSSQLQEMHAERVVLVVPKPYITDYPKEFRGEIFDVAKFIAFVKETLCHPQ